jgi:ribosomal protein L40E
MTKETLGYVRLEWTCPNCGSKNPGPQKTCGNCGAAQPEDVQFEQAAQEELITEDKEIARARIGPDIHCAYCGTRNPADAINCSQCGADLTEGAARASGRVVGAHREGPVAEIPCPSCGSLNPATALECVQCGASMARPKPAVRRVTRAAATPGRGGCGIIVGVLIAAAVLVIGFLILQSLRTKEMVGRVADVSWKRSIAVLALEPVTREAWRDDVPAQGRIRICSSKVHHVQDNATHNSTKVCGTPYTVDTGSGFGEVVQDCQYEVYRDWCEYEVTEWQRVDLLEAEGQDLNPRWPVAEFSGDRRTGEQEEEFRCVFDVDGKKYTYTTDDVEAFARCQIGSRWQIKVNGLGAVVGIESE